MLHSQKLKFTYLSILFTFLTFFLHAQEEGGIVYYGKKYIEINIHSLDKYAKRIHRQQVKLLKKLSRKEQHLLRQLKKSDSAAYVKLQNNPQSFTSIKALLNADSTSKANKVGKLANKAVDSLKAIDGFIQKQASSLNGKMGGYEKYTSNLNGLQTDLNYNDYINGLIDKKGASLTNLSCSNIPALIGMQKELAYGKSIMEEYKKIADDPSVLEEKALEWLQGSEGFDKAIRGKSSGIQSASSIDDLEKMGFQTKHQLNAQLQQKFGSGLSNIQQNMSGQLSQWQEKTQGIGSELHQAQTDIQDTKQVLTNLKKTEKLKLKLNPMRGLPFWKRIEKQYNFQTSRATPDGKPAILQLGGMIGLKHTPRLSYGFGVTMNIGLGQNWNNIHFTSEGIGLRSYSSWIWQYGIGIYVGYERTYKSIGNWTVVGAGQETKIESSSHNTANYSESVLLGLTKTYHINSKWNGAIQVLYDVWWKDKGLNTPIIIRFVTLSK